MDGRERYSVFTKPWPSMGLDELGEHVRDLGFTAVELPVRAGFQVEPERVGAGLPAAARALRARGVRIGSVAAEADERTIEACGEAGVPILRVMVRVPEGAHYLEHTDQTRRVWDALVPRLEAAGVTLGVQNHHGRFLTHAMHLWHALRGYDPAVIGAVWDPAHNALSGAEPGLALDVVLDRVRLVNLKNGYWLRTNGPEASAAAWRVYWTSARHGLCDWRALGAELTRRGYDGPLCLSAEYADAGAVDRLAAEDLAYARLCFSGAG